MSKKSKIFDIIVIGAGSGGLNIASFMNRVGFKVLLIDKTDANIGGDCLNFGCVPSKALIHVARLINSGNQSVKFGKEISGQVDMKKVKEYINAKKEVIREHENADYFRKKGMTVALGMAKFVGSDAVEIKGRVYKGKKVVIATGSRPRELNIPGIEDVNYLTNEQIFDNEVLPNHMVVLGGGPIGLEIAQAYRYLGSEVTVVHRREQIAGKEDEEVSSLLRQKMEQDGIKFILGYEPKHCPMEKELVISNKEGKEIKLHFDLLLKSIGRVLNVEGLDLDKAGIKTFNDGQNIAVDSFLRTTNKKVFLCGDIVGQHQFTHAAELHAAVIISNFFSPFKKKLNSSNLSWVTYTNPEIATFGYSEADLKAKEIAYKVYQDDILDDDRAIVDDIKFGMVKLFLSPKGKLLGGTVLAPNAGETFQELVLANTLNIPVKKMFKKVYPYPTATRMNKKIIGMFMGEKLTSRSKKILKLMFH